MQPMIKIEHMPMTMANILAVKSSYAFDPGDAFMTDSQLTQAVCLWDQNSGVAQGMMRDRSQIGELECP
jgi:hypothetical protein